MSEQTTTSTSEKTPYMQVVEGYAPSLPDVPIYIPRSEEHARKCYTAPCKRYRVTVTIEELDE